MLTADSIGSLTSPCQGGCGQRPPMARPFLVDRIQVANRASSVGDEVQVRLDACPSRDSKGRVAMVTGVSFRATVSLTTTDTTNEEVPGYQLFSKFGQIFLEDVSGHMYLAAVDGRNLIDDKFFRNGRLGPEGVGSLGLAADIGTAQANSVAVNLFFPFGALRGRSSLKNAIPLEAIRQRGPQALRFQVASMAGTFTNVTDSGFTGTIYAYLHVVYLPFSDVNAAWQLENYTEDDQSGRLRHADRIHEYIVNRPYAEDGFDLTSYDGYNVQVGDFQTIRSLTDTEMRQFDTAVWARDLYAVPGDSDSLWGDATAPADGGYRFVVPPANKRLAMGSGVVTFNYATRGDSSTRYLHRTILCQNAFRAAEITRAVKDCGCKAHPVQKPMLVDEESRPVSGKVDPAATLRIPLATHMI